MIHVERALAKLTLSLRVVGRRDDGMHLIDGEMVTVDLADTLEIDDEPDAVADDRRIEVVPANRAGGLPVPAGPDNTVARALAAVGRAARVRLVKAIPAGAGLGGGSADAAAILRWAGVDDPVVAAAIGADVAFCLRGGRARVTGIGERVEPLAPIDATYTLVIPPFGCSTAAVYAAWDDLGGATGPGRNDLESAALAVEPRLRDYRDRLAEHTGGRPTLAGSGSTWFVEGAHPGPGFVVVRTAAP